MTGDQAASAQAASSAHASASGAPSTPGKLGTPGTPETAGLPPALRLDLLQDIVFQYHLVPTGGFDFISPSVEALTGFTPAEHYTDPFLPMRLVHPDDRGIFDAMLRDPAAMTEPFHLRWVHKDGHRIVSTEQRISPLLDAQGHVVGIVGVVRDVTGRQATAEALRESEQRFRVLAQSAFEGIVVHDAAKVLMSNATFARMLGYESHEVTGKATLDFIAPESRDVMLRSLQADRPKPFQVLALRKDGSTFVAEAVGRALPYEGRTVRVTAIRDVTERRLAEDARVDGLDRLREVERLKQVDRFKTQFINTAAHELGTPLTPIRLQLHLLKTSRSAGLTEPQRKSVEVVDRNVERLSNLVQDVLEAARLQAGRLGVERAPIDVAQTLHEALESFAEPAKHAGVTLDARIPAKLPCLADEARLTQVLFNLLSNALKFTPKDGTIRIEAWGRDDLITVRVKDSGLGLKAEDIAKLFQPFTQVHDPMQRTHAGTGLGLYICKGILELHDGRIVCESEGVGKGTAFTFSFPAGNSEAALGSTDGQPAAGSPS